MVTRAWMAFGAVSVLALGLTAAPQHATALDCSAGPGGNDTWVYRTVEGKKCWYRGTKVIPKAELHWPAASATKQVRNAQASLVPATLPTSANDERHFDVLPINLQPLNQADTFDARWRGLPR